MLRRYNLPSGEASWIHPLDGDPEQVVVSHDGLVLAVLDSDGRVHLRDVGTGAAVGQCKVNSRLSCIALPESGQVLWAGTSEGSILRFEVGMPAPFASFHGGMAIRSIGARSNLEATACDAVGRVHSVVYGSSGPTRIS